MQRSLNTQAAIITRRTAYDIAAAFSTQEQKRPSMVQRGAVVKVQEEKTGFYVEALYVDGAVQVATFDGKPKVDSSNIDKLQTFPSVQDFYKKYRIGGF